MKRGSAIDKPHSHLLHNQSMSPLQREQSCSVKIGHGIRGGYVRTKDSSEVNLGCLMPAVGVDNLDKLL